MILQKVKNIALKMRNIYIWNSIKNVRKYSEYLSDGWYVCRDGQWDKTTSIFDQGLIYHKKEKQTRISSFPVPLQNSVKIYQGSWSGKHVAVYPEYVVSYYDKRAETWFQNMQKYCDVFPYPICKSLALDFEKRVALQEKVNGTTYFDAEHIIPLAKSMLRALKMSSPIIGHEYNRYTSELKENGIVDIVSFIQHGDATANNVIWESETVFKFIDYDGIGVYPLLYDFFRLILVDFGQSGLNWYISGVFDEEIKNLFNQFENCSLIQGKDKYLAVFYVFSHGRWIDSWADPNNLPKEYELTIRAISHVIDA